MGLRLEQSSPLDMAEQKDYRSPGTFGSAAAAAWDLGVYDRTSSAISQFFAGKEADEVAGSGEVLSNTEIFKQTGMAVKEPMTLGRAYYLQTIKEDIAKQQAVVDRETDNFWGKLGSFVGGMGSASFDPVDIGLGALTGMGAGTVASKVGLSGAKKLAAGAAADFALNYGAEEIVGAGKEQLGEAWGFEQKLMNATLGTVFGLALSGGASKVSKIIDRLGGDAGTLRMRAIRNAFNNGHDPNFVINAIDSELIKLTDIDPRMDLSLKETIGTERAELMLKDSEDMNMFDLTDKMREEANAGRFTEEEVLSLRDRLEEKGYTDFSLFEENPQLDIGADVKAKIKETSMPRKEFPELDQRVKETEALKDSPRGETPESMEDIELNDIESVTKELEQDYEAAIKEQPDAQEFIPPEIREEHAAIVRQEVELDKKFKQDEKMAICMGAF